MRALLSVSDREGLVELARGMIEAGVECFATDGTRAHLTEGGIEGIRPVTELTETNEILGGEPGGGEAKAEGTDPGSLSRLVDSIRPRDYFAITAYLPPTAENEKRLERIRVPVRDAKRVATTVGFGPRFLHSTGQLHKGGPDSGVFLQLTADPAITVSIPGRPWGFEKVIAAQAAGDLAALRSRGRRALRQGEISPHEFDRNGVLHAGPIAAPPLIRTVCPVIIRAPGPHRYATAVATSDGTMVSRRHWPSVTRCRYSSDTHSRVISVVTKPGPTALTAMP